MLDWVRDVLQFHRKFKVPIQPKPALSNDDRRLLRIKLLKEEFEEYLDAEAQDDLVEIADGLADIVYVAIGTAIEYGIDLRPVWNEVHRTNMHKMPAPDGGKIQKPADWQPPMIQQVLDGQAAIPLHDLAPTRMFSNGRSVGDRSHTHALTRIMHQLYQLSSDSPNQTVKITKQAFETFILPTANAAVQELEDFAFASRNAVLGIRQAEFLDS